MKKGTLFLVILFPNPWPVNKNTLLVDNKENGINLQVIAHTDGHLSFLVKDGSKILIGKHFQKISIVNVGRAIIYIRWDDKIAQILIGGKELNSFDDKTTFILEGKEVEEKPLDIINLPNPDTLKDDIEHFFIEILIDIIKKLQSNRKYSIIKASGLLRQLFLDKEPFIYKVNKKYKTKLEFEVIEYREKIPIETGLKYHITNLNPHHFPGAKTVKTSLKEFLSIDCITYDTSKITVQKVIKYCAHIKGGIHSGKAEDNSDKILIFLDENMKFFEEESSITLLKDILQIVIKGLIPLVNKISINVQSAT